MLQRAETASHSAFFPLGGLVSLMIRFQDGFQAEVGVVGRDGMIGVSALSGATQSGVDAIVYLDGHALQVGVADLRELADRAPADGRRLLRYGDQLRLQTMQISACNGHHAVEQRLARWLLMVLDRVGGSDLTVTQEMLASVLCVHRPSVTLAAGRLQRSGAIRNATGRLVVTDLGRLRHAACECHAALQQRIRALGPE